MKRAVGWGQQWTKVFSTWRPQRIREKDEGRWTGRPSELLSAEADRSPNIWTTDPQENKCRQKRPDPEALRELPPITAEDVLQASKTFSRDAASTYDGFHPKHFSLLPLTQRELVARCRG
eukprot:4335465-Pyramimonas_sp.AAC.1